MSAQLITQGWGAGLGISITVATPPFPNVPSLPGVPQLARSLLVPTSAPPTIGTSATAGAIWQSTQARPVWGVFAQEANGAVGPSAITIDSVMDLGYRQEYKISNYPVQQGQFASYNKVLLPFETSIVLIKGGNSSVLATFLQQIDAVIASLDLFNIRTDAKTYTNCNCQRVEIARHGTESSGKITAELFFIQIVEVQSQYSSTQTTSTANASVPSAVPSTNTGLTQGTTPSSAVQAAASAAVANPTPTG